MKKRILSFIISLTFTIVFIFRIAIAAIIPDDPNNPNDGWKDPRAYRPLPVLFVHGFASGGPWETWVERERQPENKKPKLDEKLKGYFEDYYIPLDAITQKPILALPGTVEHPQTRYPYLELISFIDFSKTWRSQLIDRNSSVDTYQEGDYYVRTNERLVGALGWSDKLQVAIQQLRENYKDKNGKPQKIILVCHSMGGLATREYLTNPKYSMSNEIKEIILIGVPNLGSSFASLANGITSAQRVGWFIPGVGWLFSSGIEVFDKIVEHRGMVDIDGDAVRDMDPSERGSGFLALLNGRPQPAGVDYFAIWGNGNSLTDILVSRQLYDGEGDGVVSKDSQLGFGILTLKDSFKLENTSHGNEALAIVQKDAKPLLKFIDYTKPEVIITSPDPNASPITEIKTLSLNVKGAISKEYLPADCILKIETKREEDGEVKLRKEGKFLYPSDQWIPSGLNSIVAEFDEMIEFAKPGTYTIMVTITNPAESPSETKTTKVKVTIQNPIIYIQAPASKITERRPLIKARIYSPDKINIDLPSIQLKLDNAIVTHTVTPETGGSDITISYTSINDLSINNPDTSGVNEGKHTIVVNAKDVIGLVAQERTSTFEVFLFVPRKIVEWMRAINQRQRIVTISQTTFYNYMPGRNPYKVSLGTPDGGNTIPSIDALDSYMFLPEYIIDLRKGIEDSLSRYWNSAAEKSWTRATLYQAAMGTTGTGAGKDTWTHTSSQMSTNGIETIDLLELQKCIEKLDIPMIAMENKQGMEYYYLRKWSLYNPAYGYYGSYNDCQNATPDTKNWSGGGGASGQLAWLAYSSKDWYIGRYYWSFDTSVLSGLSVISAKLNWEGNMYKSLHKYYRDFTLNIRQTIFDAISLRIPSDWGQGTTIVASINTAIWTDFYISLIEIPISFINTSGRTQFELTSSRDEAKDEPPMPPESGEGNHEYIKAYPEKWDDSKYVPNVQLIITVAGLKN